MASLRRWLLLVYTSIILLLCQLLYTANHGSRAVDSGGLSVRSLKQYHDEEPAVSTVNEYQAQPEVDVNKSVAVDSNAHLDRIIYIITPTYVRGTQRPDVTRFAQTLMNVRNIHWIVVEDSKEKTTFITETVARMPFPCTHLIAQKSVAEAKLGTRGCSQRNAGLQWVKDNGIQDGILYFADDDNAYDIRLFEELRRATKVGFVPTGNLAKTGLSSPVIKHGKVTGYLDVWPAGRKWPVEMASIGVNINFWRQRGSPLFIPTKRGFVETHFLEAMKLQFKDVEPLANNCTEFLVWHTKTMGVKVLRSASSHSRYKNTNIAELTKLLVF